MFLKCIKEDEKLLNDIIKKYTNDVISSVEINKEDKKITFHINTKRDDKTFEENIKKFLGVYLANILVFYKKIESNGLPEGTELSIDDSDSQEEKALFRYSNLEYKDKKFYLYCLNTKYDNFYSLKSCESISFIMNEAVTKDIDIFNVVILTKLLKFINFHIPDCSDSDDKKPRVGFAYQHNEEKILLRISVFIGNDNAEKKDNTKPDSDNVQNTPIIYLSKSNRFLYLITTNPQTLDYEETRLRDVTLDDVDSIVQKIENKSKEIENKSKEIENKSKEIENKSKEIENKSKKQNNNYNLKFVASDPCVLIGVGLLVVWATVGGLFSVFREKISSMEKSRTIYNKALSIYILGFCIIASALVLLIGTRFKEYHNQQTVDSIKNINNIMSRENINSSASNTTPTLLTSTDVTNNQLQQTSNLSTVN